MAGVVEAEQLDLASITRDVELQPREHLNSETVEQYAEAMGEGAIFPAVRVYFDGERYWLSQGFHRAAAAEKAGLVAILAVVVEGDRQAALWDAAGSNCEHDTSGVRRSNADKRRAVEMALKARPDLSDREIARQVGVSHDTVNRHRGPICPNLTDSTRTVQRNGTTYTMKTESIGQYRRERDDDTYEDNPSFTEPPRPTPTNGQAEMWGDDDDELFVEAEVRAETEDRPLLPPSSGGRVVEVFPDPRGDLAEQFSRHAEEMTTFLVSIPRRGGADEIVSGWRPEKRDNFKRLMDRMIAAASEFKAAIERIEGSET